MAAACAWLLDAAGLEPGFSLRAAPVGFDAAFRAGSSRRKIVGGTAKPTPFVVDGGADLPSFEDHTGSAEVVVITGDAALSDARARRIAAAVPEAGIIVCDARLRGTYEALERHARAAMTSFALDVDAPTNAIDAIAPIWLGATVQADAESGAQPFDLFVGGSSCGRFALPRSSKLDGTGAARIAVGAIGACAQGFAVDIEKARTALTTFGGFG